MAKHTHQISLLRKIFLRFGKKILILGRANLEVTKSTYLCRHSTIIAKEGKILLGKHTRIGNYSELVTGKNTSIIIKDYTTLYSNCKVIGDVEIQRYCTLAANIYMSSGNHYATYIPELPIKMQDKIVLSTPEGVMNHNKKIQIHEDVWIGNGVFIGNGITIGRGAIVGAGSVVTKDIAPYSIVAGMPGRKIKSRLVFSPPGQLSCQKVSDFPYFYQGFHHMTEPEKIQKNGFLLIDKGLIKITPLNSTVTLSGICHTNTTLISSAAHSMSKSEHRLTPGPFQLKLDDLNPDEVNDILLTTTSDQSISITAVN